MPNVGLEQEVAVSRVTFLDFSLLSRSWAPCSVFRGLRPSSLSTVVAGLGSSLPLGTTVSLGSGTSTTLVGRNVVPTRLAGQTAGAKLRLVVGSEVGGS